MEGTKAFIVILISLLQNAGTLGLIGYDCGNHITNITTISLVDVGECDIREAPVNVTTINGQLLQLNDFDITPTYKCSVKITRVITHCGMHSHASRVAKGEISFYKSISREECLKMQTTGFISIYNVPITGLQANTTINRPVTFAGSATESSSCKGGSYNDEYGQYNSVYVAGWVEITLQDYYAQIDLEADQIKLTSGVTCKLSQGECTDYDGGSVFWKDLPENTCRARQYSLLYEGKMSKIHEIGDNKIIYSLESQEITFALFKRGEIRICNAKVARTEHPKLFILEDKESNFVTKAVIAEANLDMFAFVNSKFLYVEKFIRKQLNTMYYDILRHKCDLERKIMTQALTLATIAPEETAFKIMGEPGYIAVTAGEVIHLLKCIRVEVDTRIISNKDECYEQIPVKHGQNNLFLAPRTRILTPTGRQIPCDKRLPIMYKLTNNWYKLLPEPVEVKRPEILKPNTRPTWKYVSPETLAITGIYNQHDLRRLRDTVLFPIERHAIVNKVALGITGHQVETENMYMYNLFNKETIAKLAENAWNKMWTNFLAFGTASAGLIGFIMVCRLIKLLIDTVIHGYALYSLYGFSVHLLGAVWNSVTQLLLHLGQRQQEDARPVENNELTTVDHRREERDKENNTNQNKAEEKKTPKIYPDIGDKNQHNSM